MAGSGVLERHCIDEILHRVGGDHLTVVALGVSRYEVVAEDVDADPAAEHPAARVGPVERDVVLAIADVAVHERSRSSAIATIARRPSCSSSSRVRRSLACRTLTMSFLGRRLTNTTKRNPKRCSYSAFSRRRTGSWSAGRRSAPCCLGVGG